MDVLRVVVFRRLADGQVFLLGAGGEKLRRLAQRFFIDDGFDSPERARSSRR